MPSSDLFMRYPSRRSVVHSTKGIVSSSQPLATSCGIRILNAGGNAADAAVATAAALNITEPGMTGIGGDVFCLYYDAKTKRTRAFNGSGRSGSKVTLKQMRDDLGLGPNKKGSIPFTSVYATTVPGAAAGWVDIVEKLGSGKVSLEQILTPAIELGEEGFPVSQISSKGWQDSEHHIKRASPNFAEILKPDPSASQGCRAPRPGEIFRNPNLSNTFRLLAKQGKKGFYEGIVAEEIIKVVKQLGGRLELEDLKHHADIGTEEVEGIHWTFKGQGISPAVKLWEHPPNGQGLVALLALGIFEQLEANGKIRKFKPEDHNSTECLHAIIEALRLAFSDGKYFIADPNVSDVPVDSLLSKEYLASRAAQFSPKRCIPVITHGPPVTSSSDTVYFSVTDKDGNAASFINSNYAGFGTAIVPRGCGFTLQNRGANFTLQPENHPNILAPNKRPYHTIIPAMITNAEDDSLYACFGVMGGYMQPQGHLQVLLNLLVFGMNEQEALDAPRICIEPPGTNGQSMQSEEVYVEEGISENVIEELKKLGHNVVVLTGYQRAMFGRGQIIRRHQDGEKLVWSAGCDPRSDGQACPM